jgi:AAA15 family ATPase/GTPase
VIKSLTIENFRCFKKAQVSDLKRVNIIVGKNGSGKSALLETLCILSGHFHSMYAIAEQRLGFQIQSPVNFDGFESLWKSFFAGLDLGQEIRIETVTYSGEQKDISIFQSQNKGPFVLGSTPSHASFGCQIRNSENKSAEFSLELNPNGTMGVSPVQSLDWFSLPLSLYPASTKHSPLEVADRFSFLSRKGREERIIGIIRALYPQITGLSLERISGETIVFASTSSIPEKVPVQFISDGIYRLLAIMLGFPQSEGGLILIDEIENGLYFATLPKIWEALYQLAVEFDAQIFVTTHSDECLKAAWEIARKTDNEFTVIRTEAAGIEIIEENPLHFIDGESFKDVMEFGMELR